jgi:hypothetical protein
MQITALEMGASPHITSTNNVPATEVTNVGGGSFKPLNIPTGYEPLPQGLQIPSQVTFHTQSRSTGILGSIGLTLVICVIGVVLLVVLSGVLYVWASSLAGDGDFDGDGIINSEDPDDDNDGFDDHNDWYDMGNGGIELSFTKFQIWSSGDYDSNGGKPDVYSYVGYAEGNCDSLTHFAYLDDINNNVDIMYDWNSYLIDFDEDASTVCIEVTIYDEDSWAPDEILDYIPGNANYYQFTFDLSAGEGEGSIAHDNRGENSLSILLEFEFKHVALQ